MGAQKVSAFDNILLLQSSYKFVEKYLGGHNLEARRTASDSLVKSDRRLEDVSGAEEAKFDSKNIISDENIDQNASCTGSVRKLWNI